MSKTRTSPAEPPLDRRLDRPLWMAARRIHGRLVKDREWLAESMLPESAWSDCQAQFRRIRKALSHHWEGAVRVLRRDARDALTQMLIGIENSRNAIDPERNISVAMSTAEIYRDLLSLYDEFPEVRCDLGRGHLSAVTDPIELEEVFLGAFEIRLHFLHQPLDYEIVACDPQPPDCCDHVTHPHVEDQVLCEGEGRAAIRKSLQQGRLADFFLIVRQILNTYNSSSAYVALDRWQGRDCPGCGSELDDEECSQCESCGSDFCLSCIGDCAVCGSFGCDNCQQECPECEERVCRHCLKQCRRCREPLCERCLNDENCRNCRTREKEDEQQSAAARTALHAVCVGETVVSA